MKRWLAVIVCFVIILSLCACSNQKDTVENLLRNKVWVHQIEHTAYDGKLIWDTHIYEFSSNGNVRYESASDKEGEALQPFLYRMEYGKYTIDVKKGQIVLKFDDSRLDDTIAYSIDQDNNTIKLGWFYDDGTPYFDYIDGEPLYFPVASIDDVEHLRYSK